MNLVWDQYTLFDSSRFIHSDCGSSSVKMAMQTGEHCWKKNCVGRGLEPATFGFQVSRYVEWDLNVYCTAL